MNTGLLHVCQQDILDKAVHAFFSFLVKQDGASIFSNSREKLRSQEPGSLLTVMHLYLNRHLHFLTSLPELVKFESVSPEKQSKNNPKYLAVQLEKHPPSSVIRACRFTLHLHKHILASKTEHILHYNLKVSCVYSLFHILDAALAHAERRQPARGTGSCYVSDHSDPSVMLLLS